MIPLKKKYNEWTVIEEAERRGKTRYLLCRCSCGVTREVILGGLRGGDTKSCGHARANHWSSVTSLYSRWSSMRSRCNNINHKWYHRYGGRGISICPEWGDFSAFKTWAIANGYDPGLSLDRKDNDGNYGPSNCHWTTRGVQAGNRSPYGAIKYRGASKHGEKFQAVIKVSGKLIHIGLYPTPREAALAWNAYILKNNIKNRLLNNI